MSKKKNLLFVWEWERKKSVPWDHCHQEAWKFKAWTKNLLFVWEWDRNPHIHDSVNGQHFHLTYLHKVDFA